MKIYSIKVKLFSFGLKNTNKIGIIIRDMNLKNNNVRDTNYITKKITNCSCDE